MLPLTLFSLIFVPVGKYTGQITSLPFAKQKIELNVQDSCKAELKLSGVVNSRRDLFLQGESSVEDQLSQQLDTLLKKTFNKIKNIEVSTTRKVITIHVDNKILGSISLALTYQLPE